MTRLAWPWLALLATVACESPETSDRFPYRFEVRSDGAPVEDSAVHVGGTEIGTTDAAGVLDVTLQGSPGRSMPLFVDCPDGYREPTDLRPVTLQRLRRLDETDVVRRVRIQVECPPRTRTAMLLVRTSGYRDVPVMVDGTERARTDADGLAHVALRLEPQSSVEVLLRTEHLENILPINPARVFVAPDHDELFVMDQELAPMEQTATRRRRRRQTPDGPDLPERIE